MQVPVNSIATNQEQISSVERHDAMEHAFFCLMSKVLT
jgi:hypothetical protein